MIHTIYANNDKNLFGARVLDVCRDMGIKGLMFTNPEKVPNAKGVAVSLNLHHNLMQRGPDKLMAEKISRKKHILMFPSIAECRLYDNKVAQSERHYAWMPRTRYCNTENCAWEELDDMDFPFISKSNEGASASNVRLIETRKQAENEIVLAFMSNGIATAGKTRQRGYVLWQEFLAGNAWDWRVNIIGCRYGLICKRYNDSSGPFASGSDNGYENYNKLYDEQIEILNYALDFARACNLTRAAIDIIRDYRQGGRLRITESSAFWGDRVTGNGYYFEKVGETWQLVSDQTGMDPELIVRSILEQGKNN